MSLNVLESNLHELYVAEKAKSKNLIGDLSGSYIYYAKSGWGIFWTWIYGIADLLGMDDLKRTCFQKAMVHTHQLFKFHFDKVIEASTTYQKALDNFSGEENPKTLSKERKIICHWNRAVKPFIKFMHFSDHLKISNIISTDFVNQIARNYKSPFSEGEYSAQLKRQHQIIKLEGILKAPLPLNVIFKAASKLDLIKSEKKILKSFVRKLNRNEKQIEVRFLHKALKTLLENEQRVLLESQQVLSSVTALEMAMVKHNCSIFLQKDPKHIAKRDNLQPGDKVLCNGREVVLGERLGANVTDEDQNVIFATNDPKIVLSAGINSLIHSLKRVVVDEESWGIKSAEYIEVDEENGFALVEKLNDHLGSHKWVSGSDRLDYNDEKIAAPLAELLQWFLKQNKTPINFSKEYLMFDHRGSLKCLKAALKADFDFNALEQFAFECAAGNRHIYRYLMEKSQLNRHPFAKYYTELLAFSLHGEKHDAADVAAAMGIIDKSIVERGRDLVKEAMEMKGRMCVKIKGEGFKGSAEEADKQIGKQLISRYRDSGAAGRLPSYLESPG